MIMTQFETENEALFTSKRRRRRRSCLVALVSFILSLVLLLALALAIPVTLLRFVLTDHNIEVIVDHVIDAINIAEFEIQTNDGTQKVSDVVLGFTSEVEGLNFITEEQISDVLLNNYAKEFISAILKQYGLSLKQGMEISGLTPDQIYTFIEQNHDRIVELAKASGYEGEIVIVDKKEEIISSIESAIGKDGITTDHLLGSSEETEQLREYLDKAHLVFSDSALWLVWGLVAFTILLLFFLNFGFLGSFCRDCGFPAFLVGGLYTLAAFATEPLLALIKIDNEIIAELVSFTAGFAAELLAKIATPTAVIGLALILVSFVFDVIRNIFSK